MTSRPHTESVSLLPFGLMITHKLPNHRSLLRREAVHCEFSQLWSLTPTLPIHTLHTHTGYLASHSQASNLAPDVFPIFLFMFCFLRQSPTMQPRLVSDLL